MNFLDLFRTVGYTTKTSMRSAFHLEEPLTFRMSWLVPRKLFFLKKLFSHSKSGLESEYYFYQDSNMSVLKSPDVIGLDGPAQTWKAVRYGCALRLSYRGKTRQYIIKPKEESYAKGRQVGWIRIDFFVQTGTKVDVKDKVRIRGAKTRLFIEIQNNTTRCEATDNLSLGAVYSFRNVYNISDSKTRQQEYNVLGSSDRLLLFHSRSE